MTAMLRFENVELYYDQIYALKGVSITLEEGETVALIGANGAGKSSILRAITGLDALRCLTDKPVLGIGEAGYRMASMLCNKFSVVTTLGRSVPALEHNLMRYGLDRQCQRVRSSEVPVLELEHAKPEALKKIDDEIALALEHDRAEAIVLGCAGMADLAQSLSRRFGVPVLDGLACAVGLCESMVRLGLKTSRHGGYAPPPASKRELARAQGLRQ